jgi:hypothetical protein
LPSTAVEPPSYVLQRWGEFLISRLSPIEWRNESFSHLVIPNSYRRIVKALVTVHAGNLKDQLMTDVVDGKGTGLVMALHGSPGTGKASTVSLWLAPFLAPLICADAPELTLHLVQLADFDRRSRRRASSQAAVRR